MPPPSPPARENLDPVEAFQQITDTSIVPARCLSGSNFTVKRIRSSAGLAKPVMKESSVAALWVCDACRLSDARSASYRPCQMPASHPQPGVALHRRCRGPTRLLHRRSRGRSRALSCYESAPRFDRHEADRRRPRSGDPAKRSGCTGTPDSRSQTMVVSRWFAMPRATTSRGRTRALARSSTAELSCEVRMSMGSCSTHPVSGVGTSSRSSSIEIITRVLRFRSGIKAELVAIRVNQVEKEHLPSNLPICKNAFISVSWRTSSVSW